ncbi:MAG: phage tail tape measure protein [Burkholderiales bacterium]|nr:phage tail tape measure protein [Burkholderiales bacterium]
MATRDPNFRITATDDTRGAFASVTRGLEGLEKRSKGLAGSFGAARTALAGFVGVLGAGSLVAAARGVANLADETGKAAQRAGVTTEAFSALRFAADLSGVSAENLETALVRLSVNMLDTAKGTGEAKDAFAALGISVKDAQGVLKGSDTILAEVADRFQKMEDGAGKTAIATRLFGRAGADLIPLLNQGANGLEAMRAEAERLGIVIDTQTARAAEQFNDDLTRLGQRLEGLKLQLSRPLLLGLSELTSAFLGAGRSALTFSENFKLAFSGNVNLGRFHELVQEEQQLLKELEQVPQRGAIARFLTSDENATKVIEFRLGKIREEKAEIERLMKARETLAQATPAGPSGPLARAPDLPAALKTRTASARKEADDFQRTLASLNSELNRQSAEGSRVLEILGQYELGTLKVTAAQKDELVAVAAKIDLYKEDTRLKEEATQAAEDLAQREIQAAQDRARAIEGLLASTRTGRIEENRRQFALMAGELERGGANAVKAREAMAELDEELRRITDESDDLRDAWQELGPVFSSAFEDAVVEGENLRDVLNALEKDLRRIGTRAFVTEPLGGFASKTAKEIAGGNFDFLKLFGLGGGAGGLAIDQVLASGVFGPFQHGGAFTVPGTGSAERLVPISAAPGERVTITPAGRGRGGHSIVINVTVPGGTTGASAKQTGAEVGLAIQSALRHNA